MAKKKLLIVEDVQSLAITYQAILRDSFYEVDWVDNLADARLLLESGSHDLVLLDLKLPDGDGLELLQGSNPISSFAKVVVMTAYGSKAISEKSFEQGAVDYLLKPFNADRLLVALKNAEGCHDAEKDASLHFDDQIASLSRLTPILDLEKHSRQQKSGNPSSQAVDIQPLWQIEQKAVQRALDLCGGDVLKAAELLEISPEELDKKLQNRIDD